MLYPFATPTLLKKIFPRLVWEIPNRENEIYLTFDDGPQPEITEWTLNILNEFSIKATFFVVGDNVRKHPSIYSKILENRHAIGNHTFHHLNGWKTPENIYLENIKMCSNLIETSLFRPPYGKINYSSINKIKNIHPKIIMWSLLSGDFDPSLNCSKSLTVLKQKTKSGSIIVFHDSIKSEKNIKQILPGFLQFCIEKGFKFGVLK